MKTTNRDDIDGLVELTTEESARLNGGISGWGVFGIVLGGLAAVGVGVGLYAWSQTKSLGITGPW
jgi:hypothetical protein